MEAGFAARYCRRRSSPWRYADRTSSDIVALGALLSVPYDVRMHPPIPISITKCGRLSDVGGYLRGRRSPTGEVVAPARNRSLRMYNTAPYVTSAESSAVRMELLTK